MDGRKFGQGRIGTGSLADVAAPQGELAERDGCGVSHYVLLGWWFFTTRRREPVD